VVTNILLTNEAAEARRKALTQRTRRTQRNTAQQPSPFHHRAFTAMKSHALETDFCTAGSPVTRNRHPYLVTRISSLGCFPPSSPPPHHSACPELVEGPSSLLLLDAHFRPRKCRSKPQIEASFGRMHIQINALPWSDPALTHWLLSWMDHVVAKT
jgi:hypothetical protein